MSELDELSIRRIEKRWISWVDDPLIERAGVTFDRTPAGKIEAPEGLIRVCAYHFDFDERPTCYQDVDRIEEARKICGHLFECKGPWNVDFAVAYDDKGDVLIKNPFY